MTQKVKAVILDWAGTAVDFGSFAPTAAILHLFEENGITVSVEEVRAGMGLMKKDHVRSILEQPRIAKAWKNAHGTSPSYGDLENLFNEFVPMQQAMFKETAAPIPGLLQVVKILRAKGIKIGSSTGYTQGMMDVLVPEAKKFGYAPDCIVCPDEVPAGRPYPWMCYLNAIKLGVYPMSTIVKVGDTLPDIEEGLNAGTWTVGVALTGNLMGLSEAELDRMSQAERGEARKMIEAQLVRGGAHYVIDGIWGLPDILDEIGLRLSQGEKP